jgi:hypothetical protein
MKVRRRCLINLCGPEVQGRERAKDTHGIQQVDVDLVCSEVPDVPLTELDSTEDASDLQGQIQDDQSCPTNRSNPRSSSKRTKNMAQVKPSAQ